MGDPTVDPVTGRISPFMNSGDPLTNSGWLDAYCGDVDFMQGCGSFEMAPLDTQRVIYAIIIGHDNDRFSSILDLRRNVNFVRNIFPTEFSLRVITATEINFISLTLSELIVNAQVYSENGVTSVQAELYDYNNSLVQTLTLYDDGNHLDSLAGDFIFGNNWQTVPIDNALYINLRLMDGQLNEYIFSHVVDKITLSDQIGLNSFHVVDDHLNNDGIMNPGENVRINFHLVNNYSFDMEKVTVRITTADPYIQMDQNVFMFSNVSASESFQLNYDINNHESYLALDISLAMPTPHAVDFNICIMDDQFREWQKQISLTVEPYTYMPNEIIPQQISGRSDAKFIVRVVDPSILTGHTYVISVSDSINENREKGFNLLDQTQGIALLTNHELPDEFAYNIPVTDGFKVIEADLPEGGLRDVVYEDIVGGNPTGFVGVNFGGPFFNGGIAPGQADPGHFYAVELEFTNDIDSSGVVGVVAGQSAFRYETATAQGPSGFFPCPFQVWKIFHGQRMGQLNACFQENPYFATYDDVWAPDYSAYGGFETLYIMESDYDASGQAYQDKKINMNQVLYKLNVRLGSASSLVDTGDKIIFDWECAATSEDQFSFIPTAVDDRNRPDVPQSLALFQNYPNPFNSATNIRFSLDKPSHISLKIYNILGQEIIELLDDEVVPGIYSIQWDGKNTFGQPVSSGLYFAKLIHKNQTKIIKMLMIQ